MARQRRHNRRKKRRGRFGLLYKTLSVLLAAGAVAAACVVFFRVNSVEVEGNVRYTAEEIVEASGIHTGDNLIALPRSRISVSIRTQLPYVEGVSIRLSLPDGVVLKVTERVAAASVESAEGRWLMSAQGKLLEPDTGAESISITGLTAVGPYAGGMIQAAEGEEATLRFVKELLGVLEARGLLPKCSALDCSAPTYFLLDYGIYRLKLPRGGDYDYYMRLTESALESGRIPEGVGGTMDLTVVEGKIYFRPEG